MSTTNYLNAKNGIEILHEDGLTQLLAGDGDPSVFGLEASVGSIFLRSDNGGGIYTKIDTTTTGWSVVSLGTGETTASGAITPEQHIALHNGNKYIEYSRVGNKVNRTDEWLDDSKTYQISSTTLNRSAGKVVSFVKQIYDYETGTIVVATVSGSVNRTSGKVSSIQYYRDNLIGGY